MTLKVKAMLKEAKTKYEYMLETQGFTDEVEELGDRIAWYCVTHDISVEEFNAL